MYDVYTYLKKYRKIVVRHFIKSNLSCIVHVISHLSVDAVNLSEIALGMQKIEKNFSFRYKNKGNVL